MAQVESFVDPRTLLKRVNGIRLFIDSTMIRAWGPESDLSRLRLELEKETWNGTWLQGPELSARQVPHTVFGQAMYVLAEGAIFAPSFLGGRVAGMHGYDTATACAKAGLASDAPIGDEITSIDKIAGIVRRTLALE
jgi:hypothetical protein